MDVCEAALVTTQMSQALDDLRQLECRTCRSCVSSVSIRMHDSTDQSLKWQVFSGGRLMMAAAIIGYFEMEPGYRFRHVRADRSNLHTTDLGPCSESTLSGCMTVCEEYQRTTLSDELRHKHS